MSLERHRVGNDDDLCLDCGEKIEMPADRCGDCVIKRTAHALARHLAESDGLRKGAPDEAVKPWLRHAMLAAEFMLRSHWSDCAIYNAPAEESGPCDCGGYNLTEATHDLSAECERLRFGLRYWRDQYIGATVDKALAAATGTAKTPKAVECEASQSGPKGNAQ